MNNFETTGDIVKMTTITTCETRCPRCGGLYQIIVPEQLRTQQLESEVAYWKAQSQFYISLLKAQSQNP